MKKNIVLIFLIFFIGLMNLSSQVLPTKKIIDHVYSVNDTFVNMYLIEKNGKYIAIDAGNNKKNIIRELERLKIDIKNVVAVFLTHADSDHVAAVDIFVNAKVYLSREEERMMKGEIYRKYSRDINCNYILLNDQEQINIDGFKIECILTPGHTPGSICFLIDDNYLFTGDSLSLKRGKVEPFTKIYNMDTNIQMGSIKKLINLPSVKYIFTGHHGFSDNYKKCFENWNN